MALAPLKSPMAPRRCGAMGIIRREWPVGSLPVRMCKMRVGGLAPERLDQSPRLAGKSVTREGIFAWVGLASDRAASAKDQSCLEACWLLWRARLSRSRL